MEAVRELYGVKDSGYLDRSILNPKGYHALLTDMNFPMGRGKFGGNSVPDVFYNSGDNTDAPQLLGWPLIMIGAQAKVPYIGMITDTNHHKGVMAATFDVLNQRKMSLDQSVVCIWDMRSWVSDPKNGSISFRASDQEKTKQYHNLLAYLESELK